jgi:hypothetical protein
MNELYYLEDTTVREKIADVPENAIWMGFGGHPVLLQEMGITTEYSGSRFQRWVYDTFKGIKFRQECGINESDRLVDEDELRLNSKILGCFDPNSKPGDPIGTGWHCYEHGINTPNGSMVIYRSGFPLDRPVDPEAKFWDHHNNRWAYSDGRPYKGEMVPPEKPGYWGRPFTEQEIASFLKEFGDLERITLCPKYPKDDELQRTALFKRFVKGMKGIYHLE